MRFAQRYSLLLLLPIGQSAPALAAGTLSESDEERVQNGEVVVYPAGRDGEETTGVVRVAAPPEVTFAAALDMQARLGEVSTTSAIEVYRREGPRFWVRWTNEVVGVQSVYHVVYTAHPDALRLDWTLDTTVASDLDATDGWLRCIPVDGGTRVEFSNVSDLPGYTPAVLRRRIQGYTTTQQLEGMRARAERAYAQAESPGVVAQPGG